MTTMITTDNSTHVLSSTDKLYDKVTDPVAFCTEIGKSLHVAYGMTSPHHGTIMAMTCMSDGISFSEYNRRYHPGGDMRASNMQAEFERRGGDIEWINFGDDGIKAVAKFKKKGKKAVEIEYTTEQAKLQVGDKFNKAGSNWKTNPGAMLRAALIRKAVKILDPSILSGYDPFDDTRDVVTVSDASVGTVDTKEARKAELDAMSQEPEKAPIDDGTVIDAEVETATDEPVEAEEKQIGETISQVTQEDLDRNAGPCTNDQLTELADLGQKSGFSLEVIQEEICKSASVDSPELMTFGQATKLTERLKANLKS